MTEQAPPAIVVYVKPEDFPGPKCQPCIATQRWLHDNGVEADVRDATAPSSLALIRDELGHRESPVVIHYSESGAILNDWHGFRPDLLATLKTKAA